MLRLNIFGFVSSSRNHFGKFSCIRAFFSVKSMEYVHDENLCNILLIVVDCGTLTSPTNGQVNQTAGTTFGQTATYSCDPGYNLVGDDTRICQASGVWSGSEPNCQGMLLLEHVSSESTSQGTQTHNNVLRLDTHFDDGDTCTSFLSKRSF